MRFTMAMLAMIIMGCSGSGGGGGAGGSPAAAGTFWKKWTSPTSGEEIDLTGGSHGNDSAATYKHATGEVCACRIITAPDTSGIFLNQSYGDFAIASCTHSSGGADPTKCNGGLAGTYTVKTDGTMMICQSPTSCFSYR